MLEVFPIVCFLSSEKWTYGNTMTEAILKFIKTKLALNEIF